MISFVDKQIIDKLDKGEEFWSFKKDCERDYVHGLFAYPAMMVPKMQREILKVFYDNITFKDTMTIFDPFMGSGTIMVEGMLKGANILGIDINPLAYLVSKVKTTVYSISYLEKGIIDLIDNIDRVERSEVKTNFDNINKWFKRNVIADLDHIKRQIEKVSSLKIRRFMWVTFSEVIRSVSNSRSSTYKLYIKEDQDIENFDKDTIELFKTTLMRNFSSTREFQLKLEELGYITKNKTRKKYSGQVHLILGDSSERSGKLCKKYNPKIVVTSPPYGDNHTTVTYGQYSVLALRWINLCDIQKNIDESIISTLTEIDNRSMGGRKHNFEPSKVSEILKSSPTLKAQVDLLEMKDKKKVSKVISFYSDFYKFVKTLSYVTTDTYVVMTVGNRTVAKTKIKMDVILKELFASNEFELIYKFERNILKKRMPIVNHKDKETGIEIETMTKENILIMKKR